jgi:hypothetical protein
MDEKREYLKVTEVAVVQTTDNYSHLLEETGGDAVGGPDEAFG